MHPSDSLIREALHEALSVCTSVSTAKGRTVVREEVTHYLQTADWCAWAEHEVAPKLRLALAALDEAQPTAAENGGRTGYPPGLLQDDSPALSKALSRDPNALQLARDAAAAQGQLLASNAVPELTVIDPDQWEPCSPAWLAGGGKCATSPRVWHAATCNHWHPKLPTAAVKSATGGAA